MKEEIDSLRKNKTWELVDHPAGQKLVSCKWLFKIKEGIEGAQKPRYKARLVAYYELEQLDVNTTILFGNLEEVIYKRQPPGYEQGNKVCLLKKSLNGLKQSPRKWYRRFDEFILSNGFKRSNYDNCVYYMSYAPGEYIYMLLYIDSMLIACKSKAEIGSTKSLLKKEFDTKELGEAKKIRDNGKSVHMRLGGHFKRSLKDFPVRDCDVERMSKVSYANTVGSLIYWMVCMRPDIAYAINVVSRYLVNPGKNHWEAVKWILKYLRGTANVGFVYGTNRGNHVDVTGFINSYYAKDPDKGRSITSYAFLIQGCVESIWLRGLLEELGIELNTVAVNGDNQGAIHLSRNHVFHERTKHINVRYHYNRKVLEAKTDKVLKVVTKHNATNSLTKVEDRLGISFRVCVPQLMMPDFSLILSCSSEDVAASAFSGLRFIDIVVWKCSHGLVGELGEFSRQRKLVSEFFVVREFLDFSRLKNEDRNNILAKRSKAGPEFDALSSGSSFAPRMEVAAPCAESLQYLPLPFSSNAGEDDNVSSNVRSPLLLMLHQSCHLHHSDLDIDQLSVQNVPADDHGVIGTVSSSEGPRRQCFSNAQNSGGQTSSQGLSLTYRDVGDCDQETQRCANKEGIAIRGDISSASLLNG
ncbi:retrovirus-related pol polyprotein from transposon TNT 1-94 [Tanacetum coccineum]